MKKAAYFIAVFMLFAFVRIPILAEEASQTEASTDQQKSEQIATETQTAETKAAESGRSESKPVKVKEKDSAKPAKTESARSASLMASGMPSSGTAANAFQSPLSGMASGGAFVYTYPIEVPAGTNSGGKHECSLPVHGPGERRGDGTVLLPCPLL